GYAPGGCQYSQCSRQCDGWARSRQGHSRWQIPSITKPLAGVCRKQAPDSFLVFVVAATRFLSAFLLFMCQPMVGKMLLPYLGGAAAVWTTCVLFFQLMLLIGYVYAHLLARTADMRKQIATHAVVLLLPLAFLPIQFKSASSQSFSLHPSLELLLV